MTTPPGAPPLLEAGDDAAIVAGLAGQPRGRLSFENVYFGYEPERGTLLNVSFEVRTLKHNSFPALPLPWPLQDIAITNIVWHVVSFKNVYFGYEPERGTLLKGRSAQRLVSGADAKTQFLPSSPTALAFTRYCHYQYCMACSELQERLFRLRAGAGHSAQRLARGVDATTQLPSVEGQCRTVLVLPLFLLDNWHVVFCPLQNIDFLEGTHPVAAELTTMPVVL